MFFTARSSKRTRNSGLQRRPPLGLLRPGHHLERLEERSLLSGYGFQVLQTIPGTAPNGAEWKHDFEPGGINNNGTVAYVADLESGGGDIVEGVFVQNPKGEVTTLTFPGATLPGGGTSAGYIFSQVAINARGDVAFPVGLTPPGVPSGTNSGLYRYDASTSTVTTLVLPGTAAPGGGTFVGAFYGTAINNGGDVIFAGLVSGADIDPNNPPGVDGIGMGLFKVNAGGTITAVVRPGDSAPGGGVFDSARPGTINNAGDIAFAAHNASLPCIGPFGDFYCGESVYLRDAASGTIVKVAQQGDPAPGGQVYKIAFDPRINARGDVAFIGDTTPGTDPTDYGKEVGVYLYDRVNGTTTVVAQPGTAMPGGGHFVSPINYSTGSMDLNSRGDVTFSAVLDTTHDGNPDTGIYLWSKGTLSLIARTGTVIPGYGTIAELRPPDEAYYGSGARINDPGQVFFQATTTDGTGVLLIATPQGKAASVMAAATPSSQGVTPLAIAPLTEIDQVIFDFGGGLLTAKKKH